MTAIGPDSSFGSFMARADGTGTRLRNAPPLACKKGAGTRPESLFTGGGKGQPSSTVSLLANAERPAFDRLLQRSSAFARLHSGGYGAACKVLVICAGGAAGSCVRCFCRRDVA